MFHPIHSSIPKPHPYPRPHPRPHPIRLNYQIIEEFVVGRVGHVSNLGSLAPYPKSLPMREVRLPPRMISLLLLPSSHSLDFGFPAILTELAVGWAALILLCCHNRHTTK